MMKLSETLVKRGRRGRPKKKPDYEGINVFRNC